MTPCGYARPVYGIPENEAFEFLHGRTLDQLCFGRYQVLFRFDEAVWVTVEGHLGVREADGGEVIVDDARSVAAALVNAIDTQVAKVIVHDAKSFSIVFEGGLAIRVIDSSDRYESFQVGHSDRLIVV